MPGQLILVLLMVWSGPIAAFSYITLSDKYLWIPVLLALAGVFSSLLPLAVTPNIALGERGHHDSLHCVVGKIEVEAPASHCLRKPAPSMKAARKRHARGNGIALGTKPCNLPLRMAR
jgi:hypothetical protein